MKKLTIAIFTAALLTGCAEIQWVRPGSTQATAMADKEECDYTAELHTPMTNDVIGDSWRKSSLRMSCMRNKGYRVVRD